MNQLIIEQILPRFITQEMKCKKAICISVDKATTNSIMNKLKNKPYSLNKVDLIKDSNRTNQQFEEYQMKAKEKDNDNMNQIEEYDCSFLKRVKSFDEKINHILIGFVEHFKYNNIDDSSIETELGIKKSNWIYYDIPYTQPITEAQYNYCKSKWLISYLVTSKEKYIYCHTESESNEINKIVNDLFQQYNKDKTECFLYDPNKKTNLATGKSIDDIINHPIINLLDNYSKAKEIKPLMTTKNEERDPRVSLGQKKTKGDSDTIDFLLGNNSQYYCEGLYVFTIYEPCIMCSMALVHNRISRIYFIQNNVKDGGLISKIAINDYNINSHYLVFKIRQ